MDITTGITKFDVWLTPLGYLTIRQIQLAKASDIERRIANVDLAESEVASRDDYASSLLAPTGFSGTYDVKTEVEDDDGCCYNIAALKIDLRPEMAAWEILRAISQRWAGFPIMNNFMFMGIDQESPDCLLINLEPDVDALALFHLDRMPWNPCQKCESQGVEYCHHHGLPGTCYFCRSDSFQAVSFEGGSVGPFEFDVCDTPKCLAEAEESGCSRLYSDLQYGPRLYLTAEGLKEL